MILLLILVLSIRHGKLVKNLLFKDRQLVESLLNFK